MDYTWGSLYGLMYILTPGSFHLPTEWTPAREQGIATDVPLNLMTYFSFTTLTTLGYGDILPTSGSARAAVVEAVLGHFYLAVLVARLVGLHIVSARDQPKGQSSGRKRSGLPGWWAVSGDHLAAWPAAGIALGRSGGFRRGT
jgi:ion channel